MVSLVRIVMSSVLLAACADGTGALSPPLDGGVGLSHFLIENGLEVDLEVDFTAGPIQTPEVIHAMVPAGETLEVFRSSGCIGCFDHPSDVLATLTLTDPSGVDWLASDPVADDGWQLQTIDDLEVNWTMVLALPVGD